jgi:hypothetical protein
MHIVITSRKIKTMEMERITMAIRFPLVNPLSFGTTAGELVGGNGATGSSILVGVGEGFSI